MLSLLQNIYQWLTSVIGGFLTSVSKFFDLIFNSVINFFGLFWDFVTKGIYDLLVWLVKGFIEYFTLESLSFLVWAVRFAWDIAKGILQDLGYFAALSSAMAGIDPEILGLISVLRIPDALTIIVSAAVTKYVLRFIPFVRA